jgi:hypothetical protein
MTWWGTRQNPSPRMRAEIAAMIKLFNTKEDVLYRARANWDWDCYLQTRKLKLVTDENPREPHWLVTFRMHDYPRDWLTIKIKYSKEHPHVEPAVTVLSHDVSNARHLLLSGALCLHGHDSARTGWNPSKSTDATFGLWSVEWIRAWIFWQKKGYWPSET